MDFQTILFEASDGIAQITLNRPNAANGMNLQMMQELHQAAIECDQNKAIRAVLVTGAGKMFSAGGDLKAFEAAGADIGKLLPQMTMSYHAAVSLFARMDAPVVMAINGVAAGGGLSFALVGDIIFAAQSARFTMAYTAAGLSVDGSGSYHLPRLIGLRRARELMLTNRLLSADEALAYNMIDRVVPDDQLMAEAEKQARAFAEGPTRAFGYVKKLMASTFTETLESQMELEARSIAELAQTADGREGLAAFLAKRKPDFKGE
jgi:2-(1,2-epoxy-1,2-dihydrophenyl)acetyl-CoA isomerase